MTLRGIPSAVKGSFEADRDLAVALAREPSVRAFAREVIAGLPRSAHLARVTRLFSFVAGLVDVPGPSDDPRDGVDVLIALAGEDSGPAVILSALLESLGERAPLRSVGEIVFVAVELREEDVQLLPPHAAPFFRRGFLCLPLDPRHSRRPFGFLPSFARKALSIPPTLF